jgi:hypothetical protein
MNSKIKQQVRFWFPGLLAFGLIALLFAAWLNADAQHSSSGVIVHEWGTFTAIAGKDGHAVEWAPLNDSTDLPQFVEHFNDLNLKLGLRGTIRMETPVLYFYSSRDVRVSVSVAFAKGLITEWYPHATRVQPSGVLRNPILSQLQTDGSITWNDVAVSTNLSGDFPREAESNRYYAARETSSVPLRVKTTAGEQQEKFLFYRGVSAAPLPLSAVQNSDGTLIVKSLNEDEFPSVILFERRGKRVGYRLAGTVTEETAVDPPVLNGSVETLCGELEGILMNQGLYPAEAHAMVNTWRDSWFEEGSRLIYIVPRKFIDDILPLVVKPAPEDIVRVFVGRLEIVTPATVEAVRAAIASEDQGTLNKYSRFLEPILASVRDEHRKPNRDSRGSQ